MLKVCRLCDRCQKEIPEDDGPEYIRMKNLMLNDPNKQFLPSGFLSTPKCYDLCPECFEAFKYEFMGMERPKPSRKRTTKGNKE